MLLSMTLTFPEVTRSAKAKPMGFIFQKTIVLY